MKLLKNLFKSKEVKVLETQIQQIEKNLHYDKSITQYSEKCMATYRKAETVVDKYNRELVE